MIKLDVRVTSGALVWDKREVQAVLRAAGNEVAGVARQLIRRSAGGGRVYSKPGGGRYTASAPGQPPVSRTGALLRSIKVTPYRSREGVSIRATGRIKAYYALILEAGATGGKRSHRRGGGISRVRIVDPRPFLTAALASRAASLQERIATAVNAGLKFEKIKP